LRQPDPDSVQGDGEEVVEQDEGLTDNASEEASGFVNMYAAHLEITEAAKLQCLQVGIWLVSAFCPA